MNEMPYQFVVAATEENIDVRLGSMGLPALASCSTVDKLILSLFMKGRCLCVREVGSGEVDLSILYQKTTCDGPK